MDCEIDDVIRSQKKSKLWTAIALSIFEIEKQSKAQNVGNWTGYPWLKFQVYIQINKFWQVRNLWLPFQLNMFLFFYSFFPVSFLTVTFLPPHCYFLSCYLLSCYFFSRAKLLLFFLFLYLHPDCYLFSCYCFSCYFLSYPKLLLFFLLPFSSYFLSEHHLMYLWPYRSLVQNQIW